MPVEQDFQDLRCPACLGPLVLADDSLKCAPCRLVYPIRNGIPVLLVDEATRE